MNMETTNMPKRVCHLTSAHKRHDVRIFRKECCSLAKAGYNVTLVVNDTLPDETLQGVQIVSTHFQPKNRMERMLLGTKAVYKKALEQNADVYHLHDPELLPIACKLKRRNKIVIFDAHEDTEEQIKDKKWIPRPFSKVISKLYGHYAGQIMRRVDAVITVTPDFVEKFKKYQENTVMVTNYPIIQEARKGAVAKNFLVTEINSVKPEGIRYIFFAGGISEQWMHDVIIRAIEPIESIQYVLAGFGKESYLNYLRSLPGWEKVYFLGNIPHEKVSELYRHAIAGLAVNKCTQLQGKGTLGNTKLFECMESEIPVICTNYPLWRNIIEENACGICVNPEKVSEITASIRYLIEHPSKASEMGKNGRKAVLEKYNWIPEEQKMLGLYCRLLASI